MLRQKIKSLIDSAKDSADAAMLICSFIDEELELSGNGWFDDDSEFESDESLTDRVEAILAATV